MLLWVVESILITWFAYRKDILHHCADRPKGCTYDFSILTDIDIFGWLGMSGPSAPIAGLLRVTYEFN